MAFIDNIVKFHTFSKSTVRNDLTLGEAVNPSGHTVTSSQVRTDDIPAFINSFQESKSAALTWAATNVDSHVRHNDILYYGANFNMGFNKPSCLIRVAKQLVDGKLVDLPAEQHTWADFDLLSATKLANANGKDVIAVHKDAKICYVHTDNNAATNSNQNSAFVKKADGTFLDHFVAPTDQIVGGQPSLGYGLCLFLSGYNNGKAFSEGESTYIGNAYAGLIHFMTTRTESADKSKNYEVAGFSVNCFEYIGDKLDTTLSNIDEKISQVVGEAFDGAVVSITADDATQGYGLTVSNDGDDSSYKVITVTPGSVDGEDNGKLVTGSAVKTYVDEVALGKDGAISDAISGAITDATLADGDDAIANSSPTAAEGEVPTEEKLVTAGQVKDYVENHAQVTVKSGDDSVTSTGFEFVGSGESTDDIIVSSKLEEVTETDGKTTGKVTYSATLSKATVADDGTITNGSFAVSATDAKTIVDKAIEAAVEDGEIIDSHISDVLSANTANVAEDGTITTGDESKFVTAGDAEKIADKAIADSLASTEDGTIGKAISDVADTANSAVQSVSRADGSSTLLTVTDGTNVTISLSTDVATKTDAGTIAAEAITTSLASTADNTIGKAVADAKKAGTDAQTAADNKVADVTVDGASIVTGDAGSKTAALITTKGVSITPSAESDSTALATEASVAKALASITSVGVSYQVLADGQTHTSVTAPVNGRIYLEKDETDATAGIYIEWMYTNESGWEKIGSTKTDHSSYASTITVNGSPNTVTDSAVDLGAFASSVTAGNGVASGSVSTTGALSLTLTEGSTSAKGIVQLTDGYTSTDDTQAATGKSIAAAIGTLATSAPVGEGAVKVSQTNGVVSSVTVDTEALVSENAIKESTTSETALITAKDALEAIKLAKPENYVASVTGYTTEGAEVTTTQGAAVKVLDGRGTSVTADDLWGTTATMDADGVITIDRKYLSNPNGSEAWDSSITKVEDNKAYVGDTLYGNIQTDMIKDGSYMFHNSSQVTSFNGGLSNLTNGTFMFNNCQNLTTFSSDLSNLTNGTSMFSGTKLTSFSRFNIALPNLINGQSMFSGCSNFNYFDIELPNLTNGFGMFSGTKFTSFDIGLSSLRDGRYMFDSCESLETFSSDLSSLRDGDYMFYSCQNLTTFSSQLPNLTDGINMFYNCKSLTSFNGDLSSLTDGSYMFAHCNFLTSFNGDLSSLTVGINMFDACSELTSFNGDLSSLTDGRSMFCSGVLDTDSVECIADTINDVTGLEVNAEVTKRIDIKIGNTTPNDEEDAAFKQMQDKGWSVYVNGSGTVYVPRTGEASLEETGETTVAPQPYWAKPIEVTEDKAEYVGQDGKFYQVVGGQFIYVSDPDTYGMFVSLEDAIANMRLTKYVKPVEEA